MGKRASPVFAMSSIRDTPTCVGKSGELYTQDGRLEGHPHVCGEEPTHL